MPDDDQSRLAADAQLGRMVGDLTISYSVRELLSRIEERQIRTDENLAKLATAAEVDKLRMQVAAHEARWNRVLGAAIAAAVCSGGAAGWLTTLLAG
jgi:hypothetical protein